jgi:hypothetical protein
MQYVQVNIQKYSNWKLRAKNIIGIISEALNVSFKPTFLLLLSHSIV